MNTHFEYRICTDKFETGIDSKYICLTSDEVMDYFWKDSYFHGCDCIGAENEKVYYDEESARKAFEEEKTMIAHTGITDGAFSPLLYGAIACLERDEVDENGDFWRGDYLEVYAAPIDTRENEPPARQLIRNAMFLYNYVYGSFSESGLRDSAFRAIESGEITDTIDNKGNYCLWLSEVYNNDSYMNYLYYPNTGKVLEYTDDEMDGVLY